MVMLHGCTQDPFVFAQESGMNLVAEKHGFAVIYPQQEIQFNLMKCWNWFLPESQKRESGEVGVVVNMVREVQSRLSIDPDRIYVTGLSAGGALAANLIACYADLFAGAGIHTGVEFMGALSLEEAYTTLQSGAKGDLELAARRAVEISGPEAKIPAIVLIYGTADVRVHGSNQKRLLTQMNLIHDLMDDGVLNQSQSLEPISVQRAQVPDGYAYTVNTYGGGGRTHIQEVIVEGMAHAWSGAYQSGTFADMKGPNSAEMIWKFLSEHSLKRS